MAYERQDRGTAEDYASYFAGMNQSMQQKVALTTAHFPPRGLLVDMGSGSGQATFDLANLYGGLTVVGVDINPKAVEHASATYRRANLRYQVGDIADALFPDGSLDGILNSSVLHHVTSFNGFSLHRVTDLLNHQVAALKPGGVLIIRDFVIPRGPATVDLELPTTDGNNGGTVAELSTASLFECFARDFRSSLNRTTPVPFEERPARVPGHRRFRLAHRAAAEFVLRKDYRDNWVLELEEEYTYFTQADFEREITQRGLRVVTSVELYNPWVVDNRFRGRFQIETVDGKPLPFPPTNYLMVAEKVAPGQGVELCCTQSTPLNPPRFLTLDHFRNTRTGQVFELAQRPHRTLDVLPYFHLEGHLCVLGRHGFPRPVLGAATSEPDLCGQHGAGYITEPIAALVDDSAPTTVMVHRILQERAGITSDAVLEMFPSFSYFTSPGGINERVDACLVHVQPVTTPQHVPNYSPFGTSGSVQFMDATQVLRACHVGGMFDARLELNIYRLCRALKQPLGPWIGASPSLQAAEVPVRPVPAAELVQVPFRQPFERVTGRAAAFLDVRTGTFEERDAAGRALHQAAFEYVVPRELSHNTVSVLPVMRVGDRFLVGLELRDLPAVQAFEGTSAILTVPACRLPRTVTDLDALEAHATRRFSDECGLHIRRLFALGGRYFPSAGVTPEVVYPYAADVASEVTSRNPLRWVELSDLMAHVDALKDAHLLTSLFRLNHALQA